MKMAIRTSDATNLNAEITTLLPVLTQRHYLDDVPEDLQCPLCYENAISCQTACKHFYCWNCLENYIGGSARSKPPCPMCRSPLSLYLLHHVDGEIGERVSKLMVACRGEAEGCKETGPAYEIEKHESCCMRIRVMCCYRPKGCFGVATREHINSHMNRCRYNPLVSPCKYEIFGCKIRGTKELLALHVPHCSKRNMGKFVHCPNKAYGCGLKVKKFFLEKHAKTCLFHPNLKTLTGPKYVIELAFSWKDAKKQEKLSYMKQQLSSLFPNILNVKPGPLQTEFRMYIGDMPLSALQGVLIMSDPSVTQNLTNLNIMKKGVNTFLEECHILPCSGDE